MALARSMWVVLAGAFFLLGPTAFGQPGLDQPRRAVIQDAAPAHPGGWSDPASVAPIAALQRTPRRSPLMDHSLQPDLRFTLNDAYQLALFAVRRQPSCEALFGRLGASGEDLLARTVYLGGGEVGACRASAPAFTCVGCQRTVLCPTFLRLTRPGSAAILIHEALHFAGLKERPAYPGSMSAREITTMVEVSCRL